MFDENDKLDARRRRGLEIAATKKLRQKGTLWIVPSAQPNNETRYVVDPTEGSCTCPDHEVNHARCKHLFAVEYVVTREKDEHGRVVVTESVKVTRKTYAQDWRNYNLAQTTEKARVVELLHGLCAGIETPAQKGKGQRRLPLKDVVFATTMKVFLGMSTRRTGSDLTEFAARGLIARAPHFNSVIGYMEDERLFPLLKSLVEQSALPLKAVERQFAADATGFSTSTKTNYYEEKYGEQKPIDGPRSKPYKKFIKAHALVGTATHTVVSVEVTDGTEHDSPWLPSLLATAQRNDFNMVEVSADKGYLSHENLAVIVAAGAAPLVPFKVNSVQGDPESLWGRLFHYFHFRRGDFLEHYHRRSNVETVFSAIKRKFGGSVRARSDAAQKNEVMLKVLCHNLCVLVQAIYELGIEPAFWQGAPAATPAVVGRVG